MIINPPAKSIPSGYASLDSTTKVPVVELATGTPDGTKFLRDDRTWQSPGASSTNIKQTEVDFGVTPVADGTFTVVDADVSGTSQLLAQVAYEAPTGKDVDEIEMDDLQIRCQPGTGQFVMFIKVADGSYLADKFKVNYLVG